MVRVWVRARVRAIHRRAWCRVRVRVRVEVRAGARDRDSAVRRSTVDVPRQVRL